MTKEAQTDLLAKVASGEITPSDAAALLAPPTAPKALSYKVGEKGGVSVYGLGRFPVTLYGSQWNRLFDHKDAITTFLTDHKSELAVK